MSARILGPAIFILALLFPVFAFATPQTLYTDITSGPNSGGEGNNGAYLTIFGKGFGASQGSSTVSINGIAVAAYKQWTDAKITVQPGSAVTSGPIVVTVGGQSSNNDLGFTVRPGQIYFVALNGNDSTGVIGDITHPFRNVQNTFNRSDFGPGDHIVIRGGTWTDTNSRYNSFFSLQDGKGGTAADPVVVMAYPGERVYIPRPSGAGIHAWNSPGGLTVAGLEFDMQGGGGTPFGFPPGASSSANTMQYIRAVNNEIYGMVSTSGGSAAMEGRGKHHKYLGNRIHDNGVTNGRGTSSKLYHSIYFDNNDGTGTDDVELAFNTIWNQGGGRGIQIYNAGTSGITNVKIHHNLIHDIALDGILFGDSNQGGMLAYDNIVYRTAVKAYQTDGSGGGCIRFNNPGLVAAVYNNTFADCALDEDIESAALRFDSAASGGISLINNIIATSGGSGYFVGSTAGRLATSSNNHWDASGTPPLWDSNSGTGFPKFTCFFDGSLDLNAGSPVIDRGSNTVNAMITTDFDGKPRPQGAGIDIGAYEFRP
jgi:hypothetical protein